MKKALLIILVLSLIACSPQVTVTSEVTVTLTSLPTATSIPTLTEVPLESLPVEELVQKYFAGEIDDLSFLTFEQQKSFSIVLNKQKNEQRGENPIVYNNEAYIHPETFDMVSTEDGSTAKDQTIQMYYPIVRDDEGYLHVFADDQWVKINNSRDVNFQIFDTLEEVKAEITMPTTEILGADSGERAGLTVPEAVFVGLPGKPGVMMPIILLNKSIGQIYLSGGGKIPTQQVLIIENNLTARKIIITAPSLRLFQEGTDLDLRSSGFLQEHYPIFEAIEENAVYYFIFRKDQQQNFSNTYPALSGNEPTSNYDGLAESADTFNIVAGNMVSNEFVWLDGTVFIKSDN
ncbi:MAG: hypothetical protein JNJ43_12065 [Anaerolineales bacterium]|nr:hypothetical protein [Anaerolineales bacterium]